MIKNECLEYRNLSFPKSSVIDTEDHKRKFKLNGTNQTISHFKFIDVKGNYNYDLQLGDMF